MPELPEVEAARRALEEHCVGKRIRRCTVADDPKVIDGGISPSDFEASLVGKTLVAALRKGKNMWLQLDSPPFPSFQFGMAGAIYIKGVAVTRYKRSIVKDTEEWPSKYSKVFVELDDGLEFSFTDKRRFARVRLLENPTSVPPISELGPDALLEPMSIDKFVDSLSKKKMAIKALLLDQSYIAGIGNWIADEVLYQAKVHPLQVAATLSREKCEALHKCISQVIDTALEVGADSSQYPRNWIFHFREMKPGKAFVDGKRIEFITAGGRTSAFVPELQKLDGATSEKLSTRQTSNKDQEEEEDTESKEKRPRTTRNSGRAPLTKLKSEGDSTERGKRKEKKRKETKKPKSRSRENDRQSKEKVRRKEEDVTETEGVKTSQARRQKKKKARKS